jgi:hypothetical protein
LETHPNIGHAGLKSALMRDGRGFDDDKVADVDLKVTSVSE